MNSKTSYVFDDVDKLVVFLLQKYKNLTPVKLQKGLYFLYAFYSGVYADLHKSNTEYNQQTQKHDDKTQNNIDYFPHELFPAQFEAWSYGAVIKDVYLKNQKNEYEALLFSFDAESEFENMYHGKEIKQFIEDVFQKIQSVSDFTLVNRSYSDVVWQEAFDSEDKIMDNKKILDEYKSKFNKRIKYV